MKINEKYSIERDQHNFIVVEKSINKGTIKDGVSVPPKNKYREARKYYPTLEQACNGLMRAQIDVENLQTILNSINLAAYQIEQAIESQGLA